MKGFGRVLSTLMLVLLGLSVSAFKIANPFTVRETPPWSTKLNQKIRAIDEATSGNLGVYVKRLGSDEDMNYHAERDWYFASTVKVPVAIAILQLVEEGKIRLDQKLTLTAADLVDGSGEVQFKPIGSKLSVQYLLEKMLTQSDSTATDMLIELIAVDELNRRIRTKMGIEGFQPFTTILQVRYDAFDKLHPQAHLLSNKDFIDLKKHKTSAAKLNAIAEKLHVPVSGFRVKSIDEAFEQYYRSHLNSGSLISYAKLLERLMAGELLSQEHTDLMRKNMLAMTTGDHRIKAGLPKGTKFAQKTGTQVRRICNMGVATGPAPKNEKLVITACLEKFDNFTEAETTLKRVGQAIGPLLR